MFSFQELTIELMAAKIELEAYVSGTLLHPQFIRQHINSSSDTLAKQNLVSHALPDDTDRKEIYSSAVKINNGHVNQYTEFDAYHGATAEGISIFKCLVAVF